jgi:hypothetical protein
LGGKIGRIPNLPGTFLYEGKCPFPRIEYFVSGVKRRREDLRDWERGKEGQMTGSNANAE